MKFKYYDYPNHKTNFSKNRVSRERHDTYSAFIDGIVCWAN